MADPPQLSRGTISVAIQLITARTRLGGLRPCGCTSQTGYGAYAAMKGGVEVLTRYMARELGPRRITVNVIAPGAVETDFSGGVVRDNKDLNRHIASTVALGRVGLPDDIGSAVALLLSPEAGWITGQRIEVSGGTQL